MAEFSPCTSHPDLVDAIRFILQNSAEPLTIPRIREQLPEAFRSIGIEELTELLQRQVAADVLVICPKYRSAQDRYWDRTLRTHAKVLLHAALRDGPMSWSELRKKFPKYLRHLAESVLNEELAKGCIFQHPPASQRQGSRFALHPAEVHSYARTFMLETLHRLEHLGFRRAEAREALMQLLQEEEWADYAIHARPDSKASSPAHPNRCKTAAF